MGDTGDIFLSIVEQIMVTVLDSGQREMVYCACGVLINILADSAYHEKVAWSGGIRKWVTFIAVLSFITEIMHHSPTT